MSAEYILAGGHGQVMLCERSMRTFETATRNTTDINAIPVQKPDPSAHHSRPESFDGKFRDFVAAVARAAVAAQPRNRNFRFE